MRYLLLLADEPAAIDALSQEERMQIVQAPSPNDRGTAGGRTTRHVRGPGSHSRKRSRAS
jgi:hypothetical protein